MRASDIFDECSYHVVCCGSPVAHCKYTCSTWLVRYGHLKCSRSVTHGIYVQYTLQTMYKRSNLPSQSYCTRQVSSEHVKSLQVSFDHSQEHHSPGAASRCVIVTAKSSFELLLVRCACQTHTQHPASQSFDVTSCERRATCQRLRILLDDMRGCPRNGAPRVADG